MTQITYSFKKLEIKDSRKKIEKSLKNRRIVQKMDSFRETENRSISREKSIEISVSSFEQNREAVKFEVIKFNIKE